MSFENIEKSRSTRATLATPTGQRPAIERTEIEKIKLAKKFLENRGYFVFSKLIDKSSVANYLGCSLNTVKNLEESGDFPKPFDVHAQRKSIDHTRRAPRWRIDDIETWLETRKAT